MDLAHRPDPDGAAHPAGTDPDRPDHYPSALRDSPAGLGPALGYCVLLFPGANRVLECDTNQVLTKDRSLGFGFSSAFSPAAGDDTSRALAGVSEDSPRAAGLPGEPADLRRRGCPEHGQHNLPAVDPVGSMPGRVQRRQRSMQTDFLVQPRHQGLPGDARSPARLLSAHPRWPGLSVSRRLLP